MEYKVIFKKRFANDLLKVLNYLEQEWGKKVADEFLGKINDAIDQIKLHPHIGAPSQKLPDARGLIITKHNRLFYRVKDNTIIISFPADTRRKSYRQ